MVREPGGEVVVDSELRAGERQRIAREVEALDVRIDRIRRDDVFVGPVCQARLGGTRGDLVQRREFRVRRGLVQARVAVLDRPIIVGPEAIRKVVGLPFAGRGDVRRARA
jgi:hypothetical protein